MFDWTQINTTATATPNSAESWQCAIPLLDHVLIEVKGPDAEKFLQGQCTCDFKSIANGKFSLGAHCNVKGRMVSSFTAAKLGSEHFGLRTHKSNAENALATLKKYAVFSKVTLEISSSLAPVAVFNAQANEIPFFDATAEAGFSTALGQGARLPHTNNMQELWLTHEHIQQLLEQLPVAAPHNWLAYNIAQGIAEVTADSTEQFIPQEINLQLLGGVSFNKGCYTGQEIVARMHYKATLKKHMYRAQLAATTSAPATGSQLVNEEGKNVGQVVQSVTTATGAEILALALDTVAHSENVHCETNPQQKLQWLALPYAIPLTEN